MLQKKAGEIPSLRLHGHLPSEIYKDKTPESEILATP